MMNDPLLPSRSTPPTAALPHGSKARRRAARRPKPATSAKILATGLSTTAMLGMTAGYAFAGRQTTPTPQPAPTSPITPADATGNATPSTALEQTTQPSAVADATVADATPTVTTPAVTVEPAPAPAATAPPVVVDVPVPAVPGNGGGGWNSQQSSGSH